MPQRPLPPGRPDRRRGDVDGLPRLRHDARAPRGREAHASRDRVGLRPARALPPRGALRGAAEPPPHRRRDRRRRGGRTPLHRPRVRRGRDPQGADPAHGAAAGRRGDRVRDRDRPRARRRARAGDRAPRHQAAERARRRGGLGEGDRLRHRPLARAGGPDRRRPRARHDGLRLARAGARARRRRPVRHLLARRRALRDAHRRRPLPRREPGLRGDEARARGPAGRAADAPGGLRPARGRARSHDRQGPRPPPPRRGEPGARPRGRARRRGRAHGDVHGRGDRGAAHAARRHAPAPAAAAPPAHSGAAADPDDRGRRRGAVPAARPGRRSRAEGHGDGDHHGRARREDRVGQAHLGERLRPARRRRGALQRGVPGRRSGPGHRLDDRDLPERHAHEAGRRRPGRRPLRRRGAFGQRPPARDPDAHARLDRGAVRDARRPAGELARRRLDARRRRDRRQAQALVQARHRRPPLPLLPRLDHRAAAGRGPASRSRS